jgi:hypothetical protein
MSEELEAALVRMRRVTWASDADTIDAELAALRGELAKAKADAGLSKKEAADLTENLRQHLEDKKTVDTVETLVGSERASYVKAVLIAVGRAENAESALAERTEERDAWKLSQESTAESFDKLVASHAEGWGKADALARENAELKAALEAGQRAEIFQVNRASGYRRELESSRQREAALRIIIEDEADRHERGIHAKGSTSWQACPFCRRFSALPSAVPPPSTTDALKKAQEGV